MNMEKNPKVEELLELIKDCDDRATNHVLWVAKNGDVHVSRIPKDTPPVNLQDAQLRFETFEAGNEYVGPKAAEDRDWIGELFDTLTNSWPKAKGAPVVASLDQF